MLVDTYAAALRELDAALARNVQLEVEAAEWRIKALQSDADNADLRSQLKALREVSADLVKLVDRRRAAQ